MTSKRIAVIGAGAWGTTLSILLAEKGHAVTLWVYEKELAAQLAERRENKIFLPGFQLPASIEITNQVEKTKDADIFLFVVPTQFLRSVARHFAKIISARAIAISASKGIEEKTLKLPLDILKEELGLEKVAILSGPNLSAEIAKGQPAASVIAAHDIKLAKSLQEVLMLERFRVYANDDPVGVQLGGALKNIIAIAA
ncbi:MAG: NAD(P)-binding domain-containing protein, partial [Candidatus Margulisbacteria bacterium]|nr:NAD(P)-binding domain-containing protein [Candidatus Margulisiibacteriota bacterium]